MADLDPTADFLAREQEDLADLVTGDGGGGAENGIPQLGEDSFLPETAVDGNESINGSMDSGMDGGSEQVSTKNLMDRLNMF